MYEIEVALEPGDAARLQALADKQGITPEQMAGRLARAELTRRIQLKSYPEAVVLPFRTGLIREV
jgi:hypothetical protein